jgi:hypothetical protein
MMDLDLHMKRLEPFAWGYMHSPQADTESLIANGIYAFAEEVEVRIDPKDWFPAPLYDMGSFAVNYGRAEGISLNARNRDKNIADHPEMEESINVYYDYFFPYETARVISKARTPLQEKLEINKCAWAAGGGHSNPDYEMLLRVGTNGIRQKIKTFRAIHTEKGDFYDALEQTLDALELLAAR